MIVCLGWGSLIWRPGDLPVGDWRDDGPEIKVEFVRESTDHRLTFVLDPHADDPVTSLWAPMTVCDLDTAVTELADPPVPMIYETTSLLRFIGRIFSNCFIY